MNVSATGHPSGLWRAALGCQFMAPETTARAPRRRLRWAAVAVVVVVLVNFTPLKLATVWVGIEPLMHHYPYESADGKWTDFEMPEKGRTLGMVESGFSGYRTKVRSPELALYRTFEPEWWRVWNWYDYATHPRWDYPYREPLAAESG